MSVDNESATDAGRARSYTGGPRLLADIGATNACFALERVPGRFESITVLHCADDGGIEKAVRAYLESIDARPAPTA